MINIVAGLARMKVAAVLLGPAGVGLVGLYLAVIQAATAVASLGVGNVGTRQIAAAQAEGGAVAVGRTRRALFWLTMLLALIGAGVFWLASGWIAQAVLADPARTSDLAWLSLGVALSVAAGSQGALLTGLRRVGDLARISVGAGLIGSMLGVFALWLWGSEGLLAMVLVGPAATFVLGLLYVARLGPPAGRADGLRGMGREWQVMVRLGLAFMISGLVTTLGFLAVRVLVQRELGTEALGHFQAAWAIGSAYIGLVLGAMGTDYYPRLTAAIQDRATACRLVNEQTEVALLLCAPVLLLLLGGAPWLVQLLYSAEFGASVEILRWMLLGDILKVMSWPLGFVILAAGAGKTFVLTETVGIGMFVIGVAVGLPVIGVAAAGGAFFGLYVVYLPMMWWLGWRRIGFRWSGAVIRQATMVLAAAAVVAGVARLSEPWAAASGVVLAFAFGVFGIAHLGRMAGVGGRLAWLCGLCHRALYWR